MKITTRKDIGKLFVEHRKTGLGVEVGVQNGFNSLQIAQYWKDLIVCVDIWPDLEIYQNAQNNLKYTNSLLLRGDSLKVAPMFADGSLDFVYIDAGHSFEEVKADYEAWFPKVRKGGIVSGHDYGLNDCIGVKEFVDQLGIPFHLTTDDFWNDIPYQTWWFIKGEDLNLSEVI